MEIDKYDFPKHNPNPFDQEFNGNYFAIADKYSNLTENLSELNFNAFNENIPTGYKTIVICERNLIIEKGDVIKQWIDNNEEHETSDEFKGKYYLTSDIKHSQFMPEWNRNIDSLTICKPNSQNGSLKSACWNDYKECEKYALKISREKNCRMIISKIIDTINWH